MMRDYSRVTLYWSVQQHDITVFFSSVVIAPDEVFSKTNIPYLRVRVTGRADLECCQTDGHQSFRPIWVVRRQSNQDLIVVRSTDKTKDEPHGVTCSNLSIKSVQLNDSGLYQCYMGPEKGPKKDPQFLNGAYLQVYSECLCVCSGERGSNCDEN